MTKLARVRQVSSGDARIAVLDGELLRLTGARSILDPDPMRPDPGAEPVPWDAVLNAAAPDYRLLAPLDPPEVWACGFTYRRGPQFAASPVIPRGPAYEAAVAAGRPEIFFKTTAHRVVGPNGAVGIRGDSTYTAVEAELCVILDSDGNPIFYTAGNDVSAWDIEARNPLWLAQGKTFEACCALGPLAVTPDEVPFDGTVTCRVRRNGKLLFEGSVSLSDLLWSPAEIADFARIYNPLPEGTVIMTGTAVIRPDAEGLRAGDVVEVTIDGIGTLRNMGADLRSPVPPVPYPSR